jgi:hypothetical protein
MLTTIHGASEAPSGALDLNAPHVLLEGNVDRFFDPWRCFGTPEASAVSTVARDAILASETRRRARRPADAETFALTVESVIADVCHRALMTAGFGAVAVTMRTAGDVLAPVRYRARTESPKVLPHVVRALAALGFVEFGVHGREAWDKGLRTTIRATDKLLALVDEHAVTLADISRRAGEEIVLLRSAKDDPEDEGDLVDYLDDIRTEQYRTEVRTLNEWIARADLDYSGDLPLDVNDRYMRRQFRVDFTQCGRLAGGFWMNMPRAEREHLSIGGCAVIELDYGAMIPRLAYASVGVHLPEHVDPYRAPGLGRGAVKTLMNVMLHAAAPLTRYPKGLRPVDLGEHTLHSAFDAVQRAHPKLAPLWYARRGLRFFFTESEVLLDVLLTLRGYDVVALPLHDAIVVPDNRVLSAEQVMRSVFEEHTGAPAAVKRK